MIKGERCQRCGEVDEDRRTLHMSCFYQMDELGLPFDEYQIEGEACFKAGTKTTKLLGQPWKTTVFKKPTAKKVDRRLHKYYTLRVCKKCRADWMEAIKHWFEHCQGVPESCGSGIFVRRNGVNVEITEEEWYRENPGREPCRVKRPGGEQ